ncbi:hypothetical protein ACFGVR_09510 [Mucilaginibacter sp. AW1-3]
MKQQEIVKKIGVILNELQDQYQFIEESQDPVNDLELELFVANGHFLTDHIEILRKINQQEAKARSVKQTVKKSTITEKFFEPVIQPVRIAPDKKENTAEYTEFEPADEPIAPTHEIEFEHPSLTQPIVEELVPLTQEAPAEEPEEPVVKHELMLDDVDYLDDDEQGIADDETTVKDHDAALREIAERFGIRDFTSAETKPADSFEEPEAPAYTPEPEVPAYAEPEPEIPTDTTPEPEIPVYEQPEPDIPAYVKPEQEVPARQVEDFSKPPLTLNEILSAQKASTNRVSDQLPPIKDLRPAINLNDKMLYVKDLFNGYSLSYSEAIEILNRMDGFEEADRFLRTNYVTKNSWNEKQATADKFYALLRRRFS